jgi:hypothetical protein
MGLLTRDVPGVVATGRWARFQEDPSSALVTESPLFCDLSPVDFLLIYCSQGQMMHPGAWLVPIDIARRAGPWNEKLSLNDDGEYFARVVLAASKVVHAPNSLSFYRSGLPRSLSGRSDRRSLESLALSCELVAAHLKRFEDSPRVKAALADYFKRLAFELYPAAPDLSAKAEESSISMGGSSIRPSMGTRQAWMARVLGWKLARRVQSCLRP